MTRAAEFEKAALETGLSFAVAPGMSGFVIHALRRAYEKLEDPRCKQVFSDFTDAFGVPLQKRLAEIEQSPASYLRSLVLYDGQGRRPCEHTRTLAFTTPGSLAVYLCGFRFCLVLLRDLGLAADLIIHEELHSLGLGENPPDSKSITARVIFRCGR